MAIFNPLDAVLKDQEIESKSSAELESNSMDNSQHGICPKSGEKMGLAMCKDEQVFFSDKTRVTSPIPLDMNDE